MLLNNLQLARLIAAIGILGVALIHSPEGALAREAVSLGLAKDDAWPSSRHRMLMEEYGLTGHALVYYDLMSNENQRHPYDWVQVEYLDKGYDVVLALIIGDKSASSVLTGNLAEIIAGHYDEPLRTLAQEIARDGRPIMMRPLYEADGNWFPWGMYTPGNDPLQYVAAWKHVAEIFRRVGAPVILELNLNRRDAKGKVLGDLAEYLPAIDAYVDMYAISSYNRCKTASSIYQEPRSFAAEFGPAYRMLAERTNKPINVAETSTTSLCGPRLPWHQELLESLGKEFPQVGMVTYYFGTVPVGAASNDVPIEWGFETAEGRAKFRKLIESFRTSSEGDAAPAPINTETPHRTPAIGSFTLPWSVYGRLESYLVETGNPALNPETGDEFGNIGTRLRLHLNQGMEWEVGEGFSFGPRITLGGVVSSNDDQWWGNQVFAQGELRLCGDTPTAWGGVCLLGGARHIEYFVDAPDRFSSSWTGGHGEDQVYVGVELNFGGDWSK